MRMNLYVHYDAVTNHMMTRGINLVSTDFDAQYYPDNMILAEAPADFGRYDAQTNFKILRGKTEIQRYMQTCERENLRISNWIDFESIELMHQLTPNEIAELLYLFHSSLSLRSAFFYKLQNNYVYLTLPNGLNKTYYRYIVHFFPRFQRVMMQKAEEVINEGRSRLFGKHEHVALIPDQIIEQLAPTFASGLKIDFAQAYKTDVIWSFPLYIIEDELTLLTQNQHAMDRVGLLMYDILQAKWTLQLNI